MNNNKKRLVTVLLFVGIFVGILAGILAGAGITMAQGKYRKAAAKGPYRVFITKPVLALGITAGTLYREQELIGAVLNDLDRRGFVPIFTEIITEELRGFPRTDRLMLICRKR